jgi:hypothetical protein
VVVALFCALLIALTSLEPTVIRIQQSIDKVLGFDQCMNNTSKEDTSNACLQGMISYWNMVWLWVLEDYKSSQLRRGIRKGKRHISDKYFLLYSKINDFHKA